MFYDRSSLVDLNYCGYCRNDGSSRMPFIEIDGFKGKVFVPDETARKRKHNCRDCYDCRMCSDERCEACLKSHCKRHEKEEDGSFCGY